MINIFDTFERNYCNKLMLFFLNLDIEIVWIGTSNAINDIGAQLKRNTISFTFPTAIFWHELRRTLQNKKFQIIVLKEESFLYKGNHQFNQMHWLFPKTLEVVHCVNEEYKITINLKQKNKNIHSGNRNVILYH